MDLLAALTRQIIACRRCPRLVEWREAVPQTKRKAFAKWDYWGKPVPGFGDRQATILVVGLAPGAHGSNRTGRQFTGDASGRFLYPALHRADFSTISESTSREDGLALHDLYVTALCRCVPPANKPTPDELAHCRPYLEREIELLAPKVIVCLGRLALSGVLKIHGFRESDYVFGHGAAHLISGAMVSSRRWLVCSYHPSQQNTLTGKLTAPMFDSIWITARDLARDDHL